MGFLLLPTRLHGRDRDEGPTGAMAERWKFSSFCVWGLFASMLLYPIYGNWVWGGGWLSQLGVPARSGATAPSTSR